MKLTRIFQRSCNVAAGVPPAVEPGVPPGGMDVGIARMLENSSAGPVGKMPPSAAGGTPAATVQRRGSFRMRSVAAFTMIEIAISLGVIGFALVAIIGILPAGMSVQKDNREETLINFDAAFLLNAIRNGAQGQDNLTNYIISITNAWANYDTNNNLVLAGTNWFTTTNCSINGNVFTSFALTNGSNIVGILSTPKYVVLNPTEYRVNITSADFRAITGNAVDQGTNSASQDFAFKYRVACEIIPSASYAYADPSWVNLTAPGLATNVSGTTNLMAMNLQNNLNQIRLRFRWPVLPGGRLANGRQVFRGSASGQTTSIPAVKGLSLYYLQPGVL